MVTARRWLAGIRRCLALAGLLTLAYLVIFFCRLARIKLPVVPARKLPQTLLSQLRQWLARSKWRIIPAGALLLVLMAATAGSTLGNTGVTLSASTKKIDISQGETKTYTLDLEIPGTIAGHSRINCGDTLSVNATGGGFVFYVDLEPQGFYL